MAARVDPASEPAARAERAGTVRPDAPGITASLAYVDRCLRGHRPFAIATGAAPAVAQVTGRVTALLTARPELHVVHLSTPVETAYGFLKACLDQVGFELGPAGLDDLHNLFVLFLRHEAARGRRTVVLVEGTEHCGPRVLELMQALAKVRAGATVPVTFVLTGSRELHRVLDSPGMAGLRAFTRERFDLDKALAWVPASGGTRPDPSAAVLPANERAVAAPGRVVVMRDGIILARVPLEPGRLVIGRSQRCGLPLDSRFVSRQHAMLVVAKEDVSVVDLQSTNGTLVNGQPVTSRVLEHGDLIGIGNFRLRYDCRLPEPEDATAGTQGRI